MSRNRGWWPKLIRWITTMPWQENQRRSVKPPPLICKHCGKLNQATNEACMYCHRPLGEATVRALVKTEQHTSISTWPVPLLFVICVLIYMGGLAISSLSETYHAPDHWWSPDLQTLALLGSNQADLTLNAAEYWRLITAPFLHRNLIHITFNLLLLASFGVITIANFGLRRFWLIVACCGVTASVFSVDSFFLGVQPYHATGMTPILFGLLGVHWVFLKQNQNHLMAERVKGLLVWGHLVFIGLSFLNILPVDHFGHIGGMFAGMGLGFWFESESARRWGPIIEKILLVLLGWFLVWGWYHVFQAAENFTQAAS